MKIDIQIEVPDKNCSECDYCDIGDHRDFCAVFREFISNEPCEKCLQARKKQLKE